jgi:hypothetical protein
VHIEGEGGKSHNLKVLLSCIFRVIADAFPLPCQNICHRVKFNGKISGPVKALLTGPFDGFHR